MTNAKGLWFGVVSGPVSSNEALPRRHPTLYCCVLNLRHTDFMSFADLACSPDRGPAQQVGGSCYYYATLNLFLRMPDQAGTAYESLQQFARMLAAETKEDDRRAMCRAPPPNLVDVFNYQNDFAHRLNSQYSADPTTAGYTQDGGFSRGMLLNLLALDPNGVVAVDHSDKALMAVDNRSHPARAVVATHSWPEGSPVSTLQALQTDDFVGGILTLWTNDLQRLKHAVAVNRCEGNKYTFWDSNSFSGEVAGAEWPTLLEEYDPLLFHAVYINPGYVGEPINILRLIADGDVRRASKSLRNGRVVAPYRGKWTHTCVDTDGSRYRGYETAAGARMYRDGQVDRPLSPQQLWQPVGSTVPIAMLNAGLVYSTKQWGSVLQVEYSHVVRTEKFSFTVVSPTPNDLYQRLCAAASPDPSADRLKALYIKYVQHWYDTAVDKGNFGWVRLCMAYGAMVMDKKKARKDFVASGRYFATSPIEVVLPGPDFVADAWGALRQYTNDKDIDNFLEEHFYETRGAARYNNCRLAASKMFKLQALEYAARDFGVVLVAAPDHRGKGTVTDPLVNAVGAHTAFQCTHSKACRYSSPHNPVPAPVPAPTMDDTNYDVRRSVSRAEAVDMISIDDADAIKNYRWWEDTRDKPPDYEKITAAMRAAGPRTLRWMISLDQGYGPGLLPATQNELPDAVLQDWAADRIAQSRRWGDDLATWLGL